MPLPIEQPATVVEAAQATVDGTMAAAGGAGTIVLGWFAWIIKRAFGITIPRLSHDFKEALQRQTDTFKEALGEQRADFRDEMKQARSDFREALKEMQGDFNARLDKLTTAVDRLDVTIRTQGK